MLLYKYHQYHHPGYKVEEETSSWIEFRLKERKQSGPSFGSAFNQSVYNYLNLILVFLVMKYRHS